MKKAIVLLLLLSSTFVHSQQITVLHKIDIEQHQLITHSSVTTTEFLSKKKKLIGQFDAINLHDIVASYLTTIDDQTRRRIVFIAESIDSTKQTFTLADIRPDISPLPAILLLKRTSMITGDTLRVGASANFRDEIDKALGGIVVKRLTLPFPNITQEISIAFQPMSIIFPLDGKPIRSLPNVRYIYICRLENL